MDVTPGTTYTISVGQQGGPATEQGPGSGGDGYVDGGVGGTGLGAWGHGGGGGGSSAITHGSSIVVADVIAGGGGGAGGWGVVAIGNYCSGGVGGDGGGATGGPGGDSPNTFVCPVQGRGGSGGTGPSTAGRAGEVPSTDQRGAGGGGGGGAGSGGGVAAPGPLTFAGGGGGGAGASFGETFGTATNRDPGVVEITYDLIYVTETTVTSRGNPAYFGQTNASLTAHVRNTETGATPAGFVTFVGVDGCANLGLGGSGIAGTAEVTCDILTDSVHTLGPVAVVYVPSEDSDFFASNAVTQVSVIPQSPASR